MRAENAVALEGIVRAIADAGADVRIVTAKAALTEPDRKEGGGPRGAASTSREGTPY